MKGQVLISILVTMMLSIPLLWISLDSLRQSLLLNTKTKIVQAEDYTLLTLRSEFTRLIDAYDTSTLANTLRVHTKGQILFSNGIINETGISSDKLKAEANSNAVTVAELLPQAMLETKTADNTSMPLTFVACLKYPSLESYSEIKSYLANTSRIHFIALNTEGFEELIGKAKIKYDVAPEICLDLELIRSEGMIGISEPSLGEAKPYIFKFIPIKKLYTLYIDSQQQLRYLGHYGFYNIENQPLIKGIKSLQLSEITFPGSKILSLHVKVVFNSSRVVTFSIASHVSHSDFFNLLLN